LTHRSEATCDLEGRRWLPDRRGLAGHASSRTTETIYRHELRPVITTGADVMDKIFISTTT
jgi:hypothetical protein